MSHRLDDNYAVHGIELKVSVSPCSWMNEGYGLQVEYTSADRRSHGFIGDKKFDQANATKENVVEMLQTHLTLQDCGTCKLPCLIDPKSNRGTSCEKCFMKALRSEWDKEDALEEKKLEAEIAKMKKQGYTHRVAMWIHPASGDDYQMDVYTKGEPTTERIQDTLKKKRSKVLTDYQVIPL